MVEFEHIERRSHERQPLQRPCKLYVPRMERYFAGRTWDLSAGGALLELDRSLPLSPGDHLYLGVAQTRRRSVIAAGEMLEVEVVRVSRADDRTSIAVRFVAALPAAARRAA